MYFFFWGCSACILVIYIEAGCGFYIQDREEDVTGFLE
jgi:hypothetical protein